MAIGAHRDCAIRRLPAGHLSLGYVAATTHAAIDDFYPGFASAISSVGQERGWRFVTRADLERRRCTNDSETTSGPGSRLGPTLMRAVSWSDDAVCVSGGERSRSWALSATTRDAPMWRPWSGVATRIAFNGCLRLADGTRTRHARTAAIWSPKVPTRTPRSSHAVNQSESRVPGLGRSVGLRR